MLFLGSEFLGVKILVAIVITKITEVLCPRLTGSALKVVLSGTWRKDRWKLLGLQIRDTAIKEEEGRGEDA